MKKVLLATVALLHAVPLQATRDFENESSANIIRQQNDEYVRSLYIEMIEKDDEYNRIKSELERSQQGLEEIKARLNKFPENRNFQKKFEQEQRNLSRIQEDHDFRYFKLFETYKTECVRKNVQPVPSLFPPLLTIDHLSEAGKAFRGVGDELDSESSLLRAAHLNHASAPRMLYALYGANNPTYRDLLLQCARKKLKVGFDHGLYDDIAALGHSLLMRNNFSLKDSLAEVYNQPLVDKKARSYYYLATASWKELNDQITDLGASDEVMANAKTFLKELFDQGNQNAKLYMGKIALDEGNLQQAALYLFDKDLVNFIITNGQRTMNLDPDWRQAVDVYLQRIADTAISEKLEAYQARGAAYRGINNHEQAFEDFFMAYQIAFELNWTSEQRYELFTTCNKYAEVQSYRGYRLHAFLAETENEEEKKDAELILAQQFLKQSLSEGEMDVLDTILNDTTIFESAHQCAELLEELVASEYAKEQKSMDQYRGSPSYKAFDVYTNDRLNAANKVKARLLELFANASEDEVSLKTSTVKSLVKFHSSKISSLAKENQIGSSSPALFVLQDTINFLNEHKTDMLDLMRKMNVAKDDPEAKWLFEMKRALNKIYVEGIFQMQALRGSPGLMMKKYLIEPENAQ